MATWATFALEEIVRNRLIVSEVSPTGLLMAAWGASGERGLKMTCSVFVPLPDNWKKRLKF